MSILSDAPPPGAASHENTPLLSRQSSLHPPQPSIVSHSLDRQAGDATMGNADEGSASSSRHSPQPVDAGDAHYRSYGGLKELDRFQEHQSPARSSDEESMESEAQAGVKQIEAISQTWTKWSLIAAYIG